MEECLGIESSKSNNSDGELYQRVYHEAVKAPKRMERKIY